jgi:ribonucleoside-diphosphate reductase alpha chain
MELIQAMTRLKGQWTANAIRVMEERYLKKEQGKVRETPDEMFSRVARAVAKAELKWSTNETEMEEIAGQFYEMMIRCRFIPNSPTLMNAGKENGLQFSACFVLPVGDSIRGIFDAIKNAAIIHQSGGGTGFSFSSFRS